MFLHRLDAPARPEGEDHAHLVHHRRIARLRRPHRRQALAKPATPSSPPPAPPQPPPRWASIPTCWRWRSTSPTKPRPMPRPRRRSSASARSTCWSTMPASACSARSRKPRRRGRGALSHQRLRPARRDPRGAAAHAPPRSGHILNLSSVGGYRSGTGLRRLLLDQVRGRGPDGGAGRRTGAARHLRHDRRARLFPHRLPRCRSLRSARPASPTMSRRPAPCAPTPPR
jgi:hypothetical protein